MIFILNFGLAIIVPNFVTITQNDSIAITVPKKLVITQIKPPKGRTYSVRTKLVHHY